MKIEKGFSLKPLAPEEKALKQDQQLRDAAKMYETHFLNEMVKAMRSTVNSEDGMIKPNFAQKIFTEQLDGQYVEGWANRGGVGLADMIYKQIKEQYFNTTKQDFSHPKGAIPIAPESGGVRMKAIPLEPKNKMQYRLEAQPTKAPTQVRAPLAGEVVSCARLEDGWSCVRLDHGRGLFSDLTFPGKVTDVASGQKVESGQRLGFLAQERPVLAWNLEWSAS